MKNEVQNWIKWTRQARISSRDSVSRRTLFASRAILGRRKPPLNRQQNVFQESQDPSGTGCQRRADPDSTFTRDSDAPHSRELRAVVTVITDKGVCAG